MAKLTTKDVRMNPTLRLVDEQGRATSEFQRFLRAAIKVIEAVNIVEGEITTDMLADLAVQASKLDDGAVVVGKLAAGAIYVSTLFADEVVITSKVKPNAISELTALLQVGSIGPDNNIVVAGTVPIDSENNTGLLLTFTGFMDKPVFDAGNFGYWGLHLLRNGVIISSTPGLFYDDNFSYQPVASFVDPAPGPDPYYEIRTYLTSGPGNFVLSGGVLNVGLLKR